MSSVSSSPYVVVDPIPNPPISIDYMPLETEYSDDMYFNNTSLVTDPRPKKKSEVGEQPTGVMNLGELIRR